MSMTINGTSGVTYPDTSLQNTAPTGFGFKNRIINGAMGIWQRGTTGTAAAYAYPSVDRWAGGPFSSYQVLSQSSSVPTGVSQYSLKVQRTAGQTNTGAIVAMQTIESNNCFDLSGQAVTLSFWAKAGANFSAASSNIVVSVITGTTADQGGNTYYAWTGGANAISSVQAITTTWTKYTFTGTFGAGVQEAAVVIYFTPVGTAGADDAFYITGVQLEKGSTATSFDYRPYGTELVLCQRYYQIMPQWSWYIYNINGAGTQGSMTLPVVMRTTPTVTQGTYTNGQGATSMSVSVNDATAFRCYATATISNTIVWSHNSSDGGFSAEL